MRNKVLLLKQAINLNTRITALYEAHKYNVDTTSSNYWIRLAMLKRKSTMRVERRQKAAIQESRAKQFGAESIWSNNRNSERIAILKNILNFAKSLS